MDGMDAPSHLHHPLKKVFDAAVIQKMMLGGHTNLHIQSRLQDSKASVPMNLGNEAL